MIETSEDIRERGTFLQDSRLPPYVEEDIDPWGRGDLK